MNRSTTVIRQTAAVEPDSEDTQSWVLLIGRQTPSDDMLVRVLQQHMRVDVAPDPIMGYALNLGNVYDAIVVRRPLGGADGSVALCRELRRAGVDVPIIIMVPYGTIDDLMEAFNAGADDFMIEPFNADVLSARVRSFRNRCAAPSTPPGREYPAPA